MGYLALVLIHRTEQQITFYGHIIPNKYNQCCIVAWILRVRMTKARSPTLTTSVCRDGDAHVLLNADKVKWTDQGRVHGVTPHHEVRHGAGWLGHGAELVLTLAKAVTRRQVRLGINAETETNERCQRNFATVFTILNIQRKCLLATSPSWKHLLGEL